MRGLTGKEYLDSILDEQEQTHLAEFIKNEKLSGVIKKVLLAGVYEQGTLKKGKKADSLSNTAFSFVCLGGGLSNEQIGQDLRGLWQAINLIEVSFENMSKYNIQERSENKENPAR